MLLLRCRLTLQQRKVDPGLAVTAFCWSHPHLKLTRIWISISSIFWSMSMHYYCALVGVVNQGGCGLRGSGESLQHRWKLSPEGIIQIHAHWALKGAAAFCQHLFLCGHGSAHFPQLSLAYHAWLFRLLCSASAWGASYGPPNQLVSARAWCDCETLGNMAAKSREEKVWEWLAGPRAVYANKENNCH